MKIALNKAHWPVTSLGYGKRVGLWFQGCSIGCPGCCSTDTWGSDDTRLVEVETILDWIKGIDLAEIDGFTISGGEPLEQSEALFELLSKIRSSLGDERARDILLYTGLPPERVKKNFSYILDVCDLLLAGPYVSSLQPVGLLGSSNQSQIFLTSIARRRYASCVVSGVGNKMQLEYDGRQLYLIGIPQPGDLERMEAELEKCGIRMGSVSWCR